MRRRIAPVKFALPRRCAQIAAACLTLAIATVGGPSASRATAEPLSPSWLEQRDGDEQAVFPVAQFLPAARPGGRDLVLLSFGRASGSSPARFLRRIDCRCKTIRCGSKPAV